MRAWLAAGVLALVALSSCTAAPPPYGETVIVVDTDVPVPLMVSRLRVDLFTEDGRWFDSRDLPARSDRDWPLSFSVWSDRERGTSVVRARLRAYPEARTRPYLGERFLPKPTWAAATAPRDAVAMCASPVAIEVDRLATLRTGPDAFFSARCGDEVLSGSAVAARFELARRTRLRFGTVKRRPYGPTRLLVRRSCSDPASTILCTSGGEQVLDPGTYDLVALAHDTEWTFRWGDAEVLVAEFDRWDEIVRGASPVPDDDQPRLSRAGGDATPSTEPLPDTAIDRLLEVPVRAGERATARVVLHGACAGTMANLAERSTCIEREGVLEPLRPHTLEPFEARHARPGAAAGFMPGTSCAREIGPDRVCMPGGAFLLGTREPTPGALFSSPERPVRVEPFVIDRTEMSWKRLGALIAGGLPAPDAGDCPGAIGDSLPVTCVSWAYARSACRAAGGDLPTEAEWEWAATANGDRRFKRRFPWGDFEDEGCTSANVDTCPGDLEGVDPVDGAPWAGSDRTPFGVVGMLGNVSEWVIDASSTFHALPWRAAPVTGARIDDPDAPLHVVRGLAFDNKAPARDLFSRGEAPSAQRLPTVGFRCAYR